MKLVAVVAAAAVAGGVQQDEFRYTRELPAPVASGRVAFEPDGSMLGHAGEGFADVRVVDADGNQVPWRRVPEGRLAIGREAAVLNSGRQGDAAVALVDVGRERRVYERVELGIAGGNFVGLVTAFGADRRDGRFTRLSTTTVYDVRGAQSARSTTIVLPPTDYRFLELRATGVARITGATVLGAFERPDLVRRRHATLGVENRARTTVSTLDFGLPGVPVTRLELRAAGRRYDRPVVVEGSNDRGTFVIVAQGRMTRAPGLVSPALLLDSRFRYLRVTIQNGDDPPLGGVRSETFGPSFALMVEGGHPPPLRLLYGADVRAPSYEFARLPVERPVAVLDPSRLRRETANPAFELPGETFGERYRWLVQGALAVAALVVAGAGFLALRGRA
ncbi:MAG TPA: hypothetical protein VFP31_13365 [Gaiellaceae bacterium]|nr:hypothetical protein [Gaiellaceae bacterium]